MENLQRALSSTTLEETKRNVASRQSSATQGLAAPVCRWRMSCEHIVDEIKAGFLVGGEHLPRQNRRISLSRLEKGMHDYARNINYGS